ncbi:hypothetical protein N7466_003559 [Penicillium verhagenii]|uniref:uncharacterized protein n=1 Tax=Penicillium verhagenii TaxID=1562060 RepID=UPI0025459795|nr:uncharacterized protein N7466_003559 [Penicillium verhagenii]KAJ5937109.1 hypothetical protein N7466_003559 [Penicillium verhagenii]
MLHSSSPQPAYIELVSIDKLPNASNRLLEVDSQENPNKESSRTSILTKRRQEDRSKPMKHNKNNKFHGWKFTLFLAIVAGVVVLFFNVGFLLYCLTHRQNGQSLNTTLYEGDCDESHRLGVVLHLVINILSTALLGASNFGMQCLAAPSRRDINKAHMKGRWLDIGVPSIRNLFEVPRTRSFLWVLLALSSLPFHLMYNSAIYSTSSAHAYDVFAGSSSLGENLQSNLNLTYPFSEANMTSSFMQLYSSAKSGDLERLDNQACVDAFAVTFEEAYSKVLIVTQDVGDNDTYAYVMTNGVFQPIFNTRGDASTNPYMWLCGVESLRLSATSCYTGRDFWTRSLDNWKVGLSDNSQYTVEYCLVEKAPQSCKLEYSFQLVIVVIAFNLSKIAILLFMWLGIQNSPILTIGDAIASFLRDPDPHSRRSCLLTKREVKSTSQYNGSVNTSNSPRCEPRAFDPSRKRWSTAASTSRWTLSMLFWGLAVGACILLLTFGLSKYQDGSSPFTEGLGSVGSSTLIYGDNWPSSIIGNVLIANSPQLIFSLIYFAFNSLLTSMTLSAEWSGYANQKKGLRVSHNPKQYQRSNYFLSIPYRYGVPMMITSTLLHWLISESLFMVGIEAWSSDGQRDTASDFITCGWSAVGTLITIMVGILFLSGIVGLSLRRFESALPIAGSCSLAIAAACHPHFDPNTQDGYRNEEVNADMDSEVEDEEMALLSVQWGAVPVNGPVGHYSFTSDRVGTPETEKLYQ